MLNKLACLLQQVGNKQESKMLDNLLFFLVGLVVGWNVLPQPAWVKATYDLLVSKIKSWSAPKSE
jgi:hypothetical protein